MQVNYTCKRPKRKAEKQKSFRKQKEATVI